MINLHCAFILFTHWRSTWLYCMFSSYANTRLLYVWSVHFPLQSTIYISPVIQMQYNIYTFTFYYSYIHSQSPAIVMCISINRHCLFKVVCILCLQVFTYVLVCKSVYTFYIHVDGVPKYKCLCTGMHIHSDGPWLNLYTDYTTVSCYATGDP